MSNTDLAALAADLKAKGVRALTVTWCDSNGIQRSRTAPIDKLSSAVERGMGCSFLFAVFDSNDHIHWGVEGVDTPTGDFRLKAVPERIVQLTGTPTFAWAPGTLWRRKARAGSTATGRRSSASSSARRGSATSSRPAASSSGSSARTPTSPSRRTTAPSTARTRCST